MLPGGRHEPFNFVGRVAALAAECADVGNDSAAGPTAHCLRGYAKADGNFTPAKEVVRACRPDLIGRCDHFKSISTLITRDSIDAFASFGAVDRGERLLQGTSPIRNARAMASDRVWTPSLCISRWRWFRTVVFEMPSVEAISTVPSPAQRR